MVSTTSAQRVVALASREDATESLVVLVGDYRCHCAPATVEVRIEGYPFAASKVMASIARIPGDARVSAEGLPVALPMPDAPVAGKHQLDVIEGSITVELPPVGNGDVYVVELAPSD